MIILSFVVEHGVQEAQTEIIQGKKFFKISEFRNFYKC